MERHKKEKRQKKGAPRVPIKTYKWEDIRRERLKGGYPWTYLSKEPFNEEADPKVYTMEGKSKRRVRKPKDKTKTEATKEPEKTLEPAETEKVTSETDETKATKVEEGDISTEKPDEPTVAEIPSEINESSDKLEIEEVTTKIEEPTIIEKDTLIPEPSGYIIITEVPSDSETHSKEAPSHSVTIEDVGDPEVLNLESAESSDNISQYLDKEEPPIDSVATTTKAIEEAAKSENERQERAKSEEPKRKRKLSIDSSYSRKSLSKLAIMKRLREAKEKIKIPKLNLPSLPNLSKLSNPLKQDSKSTKNKKEPETKEPKPELTTVFKSEATGKPPVYIHIPLKPPEGKTDEFSYLEFGEKKPEVEPKPDSPPSEEEPNPPTTETSAVPKFEISVPPTFEFSDPPTFEFSDPPTFEFSEAFDNDQRRLSGDPDDIVAFEIVKSQTIDIDHATKNGLQGGSDYLIIEQADDAKSETRSMIIIMSDEPSLSRQGSKKTTPSRQGSVRKERAKSAEPERKRKLSVDSSYSRRSLSKLGIIRKLKDARDKFKFPTFSSSRSGSKKIPRKKIKEEASTAKETKPEKVEVKKSEKTEPEKVEANKSGKSSEQPKYIHIPLKPPPGKTDEFSHLEFEEKPQEIAPATAEAEITEAETPVKEEQSSIESPGSPKADGVQFIFLTPPSDDEILDHPDVPETPSSETEHVSGIHELKEIAKTAVDKASPKSEKKLLVVKEETPEPAVTVTETENEKKNETIEEEAKTKKSKNKKQKSKDAEEEKPEPVEVKPERIVVDEEDGLKLTESAMAKQEQNIKSKEVEVPQELKPSLKSDGSPTMKKKVSFKRKSKDDSKDGDYEDIQVPTDEKLASKDKETDEHKSKLAVMGTSQSMSVDEEHSYLDEKKIIKTTSLEEDYNRWSKLSDHEYEPVNPPPENITPVATAPTVHIIDSDRSPKPEESSARSLEPNLYGGDVDPRLDPRPILTIEQMQAQMENRYFKPAESAKPKPPSPKTPSPKPTTAVHTVTTVTTTSESSSPPPKPEGPGRFQQAIKTQTDKFKTKLHEMKRPNIKLPSKPTFKKPNIKLPSRPNIKKPNLDRFKFEKPKINLPKIPDTAKISLPTFSLPRKSPLKRSLKQRHLSTESNAGGSKKNYFDFRTYPRFFKKKPKDELDSFSSKSEREVPEFATVPRTKRNKEDDKWGGRDSIRIPLHPEDSIEDEEREDSVERRMASHIRYDQDIDIDDAYEKENQEIHTASPFSHGYNSRWDHGSFHPTQAEEYNEDPRDRQVTDLDSPVERSHEQHESFDTNTSKDIHSSESSLGMHRRGVLEEIDSDEFFLRQKGISQDNIEVGMYLSSEIREAFKSPSNALADLQREPRDFPYDARESNQSLPEVPSKRKGVKKPKRKKTPHVSHEQISFDQDSELDTELPPSRPKRRSRRSKKKDTDSVIPYQETIAVEVPDVSVGILHNTEEPDQLMYENEQMQGKEQPEIQLTDPYEQYEEKYDSEDEVFRDDIKPSPPPRKHRSLKSLTYSEHDSILGDVDPDRELPTVDIEVYKTEHEYIIPTPEIPPAKPQRTLSRSSSRSREAEEIRREILQEIEALESQPVRPTRTRSQSRTRSRAESESVEEPCVDEVCVQDFRDSMGYAVIDKNIKREPPLPPPRTPPRRKRSETKFFTVPRPLNDVEVPVRPIRNYSTLGPSRPPRRKPTINMTDEEKENIDITQYIEIEDEPNRDLHSGEVIQKMRDRPLPAPPRPPRKTRALHDITSEENILSQSQEEIVDEEKIEFLEEAEVSTQTEPLPEDFLCEEPVQEERETTTVATEPSVIQESQPVVTERRLITPTKMAYEEETITHGSLVIQPLNGATILPDSEMTRIKRSVERTIPVTKDYDDETSEVPEEFLKLRDPDPKPVDQTPVQSPPQPSIIERIIERPVVVQPDSSTEVEVLKAQKLQVTDLDVDRLSVNELLASRIIVSEIDSGNIQANEISSKSGALKIGEIELPPGLVQQLFERLQSVAQEQQSSGPKEATPAAESSSKEASEEAGQKKNAD